MPSTRAASPSRRAAQPSAHTGTDADRDRLFAEEDRHVAPSKCAPAGDSKIESRETEPALADPSSASTLEKVRLMLAAAVIEFVDTPEDGPGIRLRR
jgi:hypothetical protein